MTPAQNFENFLKQNHVYEAFCYNIKRQHHITFEQCAGGKRDLFGIIDSSLTWAHTDEGQDFWSDLNVAWNTACNNNEVFTCGYKSIW